MQGHLNHLYLQGEDKLFINLGGTGLPGSKQAAGDESKVHGPLFVPGSSLSFAEPTASSSSGGGTNSQLMGSKQWVVVPLPSTYSAANWPIRVRGFWYFNCVFFSLMMGQYQSLIC